MKSEMVMVRFYMKNQQKEFLKQLCKDSGMDMSEMMRSIISYFFMAYTLGQWNMPMQQLRKDFIKFIDSKEKKLPDKFINNKKR